MKFRSKYFCSFCKNVYFCIVIHNLKFMVMSQQSIKNQILPLDFVSVPDGLHTPDIVCLNPKIIINPNIGKLFSQGWCLNSPDLDKPIFIFHKAVSYQLPFWLYKIIHPKNNHVDQFSMDSWFMLDQSSGETCPVYVLAPCNHCRLCEQRRCDSLAQRMVLESQVSIGNPWHVRLSYRDQDLPVDGVNKVDCQKFMKRLRINLDRWLSIKIPIRYFLVSEYSKSGRPHYHVILWNLRVGMVDNADWKTLNYIIAKSWKKGFTYACIISKDYVPKGRKFPIKNPQYAFSYITKYLLKNECPPPANMNPNFSLSSRGRKHKGIGFPFLNHYMSWIRSHPYSEFYYIDCLSGQKKKLRYDHYVIDHLFPKVTLSVPYKVRAAIRALSYLNYLTHGQYCELLKKYDDALSSCCFFGPYAHISDGILTDFSCDRYDSLHRRMIEVFPLLSDRDLWPIAGILYSSIIEDYISKDPPLSDYLSLQAIRGQFLTKYFQSILPADKPVCLRRLMLDDAHRRSKRLCYES